jgi:hypothetical protein
LKVAQERFEELVILIAGIPVFDIQP